MAKRTKESPSLELEMGTDFKELLVDTSKTEDFEIEYNNKIWKFTKREATWTEMMSAISICTENNVQTKNTRFRMDLYSSMMLEKIIVKAPWGMRTTKDILDKLPPEVGMKLSEYIPDPYGPEDKDNTENIEELKK
jgi:hypothetical protein